MSKKDDSDLVLFMTAIFIQIDVVMNIVFYLISRRQRSHARSGNDELLYTETNY